MLSRFSTHFPSLLAVSLSGFMVLCPANAQTSSESEGRELGAFALGAGTITPKSPETGPNAAAAARATDKKSGTQPESAPAATQRETDEKIESEFVTQPESAPATTQTETNEKIESESVTQPESPPAATQTETDEKVESKPDTQPASTPSNVQAEPDATSAKPPQHGSQILINIDKSRQKMTVFVDGIKQHTWPVSTGGPGYGTPSGDFTASSMNELWYSKQWDNAPMPNSIFFTKEGHAIHGSYETKKLGRAVSHGCVRLAPENAKILYALVEEQGLENTKIVLSGVTPGGEKKVASQARSKNRNRQAATAYEPRSYHTPWTQRRGLFGRGWFGGPYDDGPQGSDGNGYWR